MVFPYISLSEALCELSDPTPHKCPLSQPEKKKKKIVRVAFKSPGGIEFLCLVVLWEKHISVGCLCGCACFSELTGHDVRACEIITH